LGREAVGAEQPSSTAASFDPVADPIQRLFAKFQALLDRHEAALAWCDRLEATLLGQMDYPRVPLPPDWEGTRHFAADVSTIDDTILPGRHRRRLHRVLQRRQRRWDEAAQGAGLATAQAREAALDEAVLDQADTTLATPVWSSHAIVLKLLVLLSTREPNPSAYILSPWRELRLILMNLRGLVAHAEVGR